MIQRIQSVYLLIVAALMTLTIFSKFALVTVSMPSEAISLTAFGLTSVSGDGVETVIANTIYMGILAVVCIILPIVTIFMYRNRLVQMRMCRALMLLLFGLQVFFIYYIFKMDADSSLALYRVTALHPFIAMVFAFFAFKGVNKDEKLIRSLDRIR